MKHASDGDTYMCVWGTGSEGQQIPGRSGEQSQGVIPVPEQWHFALSFLEANGKKGKWVAQFLKQKLFRGTVF